MRAHVISLFRSSRARVVIGAVALGVLLAVLLGSIYKPQIRVAMMDGEHRTIHLRSNQFLLPNVSTVKVAGVDVGFVTDVERAADGTAIVTVKVEDGIVEAVGSEPSAALRPNTLLGGKYYIDVVPGGTRDRSWTEPIPLPRTRLPVELDDIAQRFQPDPLAGARTALRQFDKTLASGGTQELHQLLRDLPASMGQGSRVLRALRGREPRTDLVDLVSGLDTTADVLTQQEGQLQETLESLQGTTSALDDRRGSMVSTLDRLPSTLSVTDTALGRLGTSLQKLRDTAGPARPTAEKLGQLIDHADPVLKRAVPVVRDLRLAMKDTRPLLDQLVPVSRRGTEVLDAARGPLLDRVNGPIRDFVYAPYDGSGPYRNTHGDQPFFRELAYMFSGLDATGAYVDPNGHAVAFQPGGGTGTVSGLGPFSFETILQQYVLDEEQR